MTTKDEAQLVKRNSCKIAGRLEWMKQVKDGLVSVTFYYPIRQS